MKNQVPEAKFQADWILLNAPDSLAAAIIRLRRSLDELKQAIIQLPAIKQLERAIESILEGASKWLKREWGKD